METEKKGNHKLLKSMERQKSREVPPLAHTILFVSFVAGVAHRR